MKYEELYKYFVDNEFELKIPEKCYRIGCNETFTLKKDMISHFEDC